jgi:hypothetical protein
VLPQEGQTPLRKAEENEHTDAVEALHTAEADLDSQSATVSTRRDIVVICIGHGNWMAAFWGKCAWDEINSWLHTTQCGVPIHIARSNLANPPLVHAHCMAEAA